MLRHHRVQYTIRLTAVATIFIRTACLFFRQSTVKNLFRNPSGALYLCVSYYYYYVKVNFSLCLAKYHIMMYSLLN